MSRLATIRRSAGGTQAVRIDGDTATPLDAPDVVAAWTAGPDVSAAGPAIQVDRIEFAPVVPRPPKIICMGLNYEAHIVEMGRDLPKYPTFFAKFAVALIGATDDIALPAVSSKVDYEAELAIVIGRPVRNVDASDAAAHVAGYTVMNDVSVRDFQVRSQQWLQGKTFERTTPLGPVLVTGDEIDHARDLTIGCSVDGEQRQSARTSDLVFPPSEVIAYLSRIMTLEPGDVISTGTPGGVGVGFDPHRYLQPGQVVRTYIDGIGELVNTCAAPPT